MDCNISKLFAVAILISIAQSASSSTASTTSTAPISIPSIEIDTSLAYVVPFSGLGDDDSTPWGVDVQNQTNTSTGFGSTNTNFPSQLYEITVNNSTSPRSPGFTECNETSLIFIEAMTTESLTPPNRLIIDPNTPGTLVLGLNSTLEVSGDDECNDILLVDTVPFGINVGHDGVWNGSLTFGGWYDANRVASTSWFLVPETANGKSTFLQNGKQQVDLANDSLIATLDINADSIVLPSTSTCKDNFTVTLTDNTAEKSFNVTIPSTLMSSPSRCSTSGSSEIILGRPFFQAAYAYVDKTGQIFLAAANQYSLGLSPKLFQANETLEVPARPSSTAPSPSPTKKSIASQIKVNGALLGLLAIGAIL